MKLEDVGKVLAGGFGDKVLIGIVVGFLDSVTPARAYEYIRDDLKLGYWVSDSDWHRYRQMAKSANIANITTKDIIEGLRKSCPDMLGVIINHPKGQDWLDRQVAEMKKKLELK